MTAQGIAAAVDRLIETHSATADVVNSAVASTGQARPADQSGAVTPPPAGPTFPLGALAGGSGGSGTQSH